MPDGPAYDDDAIPQVLANEFLPAPLPDHWVILPKRLLQGAAINIMLLGAALGSLLTAVAATFVPMTQVTWGVVGLIALAYVVRKFLLTPIEDEAFDEARKALNLPDPNG